MFNFCALILLFISLPVLADDSIFNMSLEELLTLRVSTSTLQEETLLEVPSSVTIIERDEIHALGVTTISELLNLVPGYQSYRGDNGNDSYFVSSRGERRGQNTKGVLFLINGARFNTNYNGGAFDGQNFPLDNVKRVEVIKGPGSAIYGSNAFLGVINLITETDNSVQASAGNRDEKRVFIQRNIEANGHQLETSVWARRRGGASMDVFDPETRDLIKAQDEFESKGVHLKYAYGSFENQTFFTREVDKRGYVSGLPAKDSDDKFVFDNFFTELKHKHTLDEFWVIDSSASYLRSRFNPRYTNLLVPLISGEVDSISNELKLSSVAQYSDDSGEQWVLGAEYRNSETEKANISQYREGVLVQTVPLQRERRQDIFGVFVQNQRHLSEQLRSTIGLRYDHYQGFGGHLSARLGLSYSLDQNNSIKLLYGEAFRAPVRTETDIYGGEVFVSNPDLEPEISKTTELIWASAINQGYIQTSLFFTELIDNILRTTTIPQSLENSGYEKSSGIEAELVRKFDKHWKLRSALTYFFDRPNEKRSSESEFLFSLAATYEANNFIFGLIANRQSEKIDENVSAEGFTKHAGFTTIDTQIRYLPRDGFEFFAKFKNLLGEEYSTPGSINTNEFGVMGYPRQFETGMKLKF